MEQHLNDPRIKILLVDDKPENLLALEALLKSPKVDFFRANSGVQALDLLLTHEFALAILDVQMPEMDGFELAELMRGTEQTRAVPIIFVTAAAHSRVNVFKGYEKGAVDFMYKPLDPHVVKSKVQIFIELAQKRHLLKVRLEETQAALGARDQALVEAKEALRVRDEFMSIASHELRTPLTSLHLQLQFLKKSIERMPAPGTGVGGDLVGRVVRVVENCERASGKLAHLLDGLLDLTRVRLGKLELHKEPTDLALTAREVGERCKPQADRQGASIDAFAPHQLVGEWDPMRIEQVVTNLVTNAIKYGNRSPVTIQVQELPGDWAEVSVSDRGLGIPPDMIGKIFERFERAVSDGAISGLGLGLYITRQIVEAHGGTISVKSELGQGSTFKVRLPLKHDRRSTQMPR